MVALFEFVGATLVVARLFWEKIVGAPLCGRPFVFGKIVGATLAVAPFSLHGYSVTI